VSESLKSAVQAAVLRLLDPLVRLLLASGIGVGDFLALAKVAYVRAARDIGRETRGEVRPNASRIAVVTGLTRAEVSGALDSDRDEVRSSDRGRHRAERVLSGWWHDPDFQTEAGDPLVLAVRGAKRSFEALVTRYSNEARISPILDELLRVNAVKRLADGRIKALSRTYATVRWSAEGIETLGEQLSEHCSTLLHNLEHPGRPRYVRRVVNVQLDPRYLPVLVRDIESQAEVLSDHLDQALNDPLHTITPRGVSQDAVRLSVSIYVHEAPVVVEGDTAGTSRREERRRERTSRPGRRASHSSKTPEG
jgi:Family of unknown function (DUF6502)